MAEVKALANYKMKCELWKLNANAAEDAYIQSLNKEKEENVWKDKTVFGTSVLGGVILGLLIGLNVNK